MTGLYFQPIVGQEESVEIDLSHHPKVALFLRLAHKDNYLLLDPLLTHLLVPETRVRKIWSLKKVRN